MQIGLRFKRIISRLFIIFNISIIIEKLKRTGRRRPSSDKDAVILSEKCFKFNNRQGFNSHQGARNMSSSQSIDVYHTLFSVKKLKFVAILIITISALYHGVLHLQNGHNTCKWLLTDGRFQGYNEWQPHGCMMHKYNKNDFQNCMNYISYWGGKNHFVFVGDSRIRQLYLEFVRSLSKEPFQTIKPYGNISYSDTRSNVLVEFFWAPFVDNLMREILASWTSSDLSPRLIIIGSALWTIKLNNGSEDIIPSFKNNITSLNSIFSKYKDLSEIVWMLQDYVVEARLFQNNSIITNRQIDLYNRATIESLIFSKAQIWSSSLLIGQGFLTSNDISSKKVEMLEKHLSDMTTSVNHERKYNSIQFGHSSPDAMSDGDKFDEGGDGLQLPQEALKWDVQVLLNMICNNYMNFDDGSCCTVPENPTTLQMILALIFATSLVLTIVIAACKQLVYMSRKMNSLKRKDRIGSSGFFHLTPPNKCFAVKDPDIKDIFGAEQNIHDMSHLATPNMKRSFESCDASVGVVTTCDSFHKGGGKNCGSPGTSMHKHKSSAGLLSQDSNKQEACGSNQTIHNVGKDNSRCSGESMAKADNESTMQFISQDSPCLSQFTFHTNSGDGCRSQHHQHSGGEITAPDFYSLVCCVSKLGIIISYFFICDRTTFFMKENKYYTHVNFFLPFTYLMVVGLFFTENTSQTQVLNRNQTDEWKGWMQIIILIYHLTGASKVLSIYMQIRVMVSAYLFLSAYGHFTYFFIKNDFSLHRLCTVIFRFNFLAILLCLAMDRPYQFYYFIPLVTFWFVIIFLVMASPPRVSNTSSDNLALACWCLLLKVVVLIVLVTLMYSSEVFFDKVFFSYFLKPLFVSSDESIHDWRFRWSVDRYSSIFGLVFTLIFHFGRKMQTIDDSKGGDLGSSKLVVLSSLILSTCSLVCYAIFTSLCQNKVQCNETHSYIAFIPILCYIVLRNTLGCLRRKFSAFFAWFGRISLELFIAQYHIWLAADTHGVLVLIPSYPVLNLIMTSFVFVCVAHELKQITNFLTPLFVPSSKILLLRNILLILFFVMVRHFLPF